MSEKTLLRQHRQRAYRAIRSALMVEVDRDSGIGYWRLRQIEDALVLFGKGLYAMASKRAERSLIPRAAIPANEAHGEMSVKELRQRLLVLRKEWGIRPGLSYGERYYAGSSAGTADDSG